MLRNPKHSHFEMVPFGSLHIDGQYQRREVGARVRYLVKNWELGKVGVLTVSRRRDGYFIIDGQHRWRAAMELGLSETKVRCVIVEGASLQDEAAMFLSENDVRPVSTFDKFDAALVAEETDHVGVAAIVGEFGLRVDRFHSDSTVACPTELLKLYRQDPDLLRQTLATAIRSWGSRPESTEAVVLRSLGLILGAYNGQLDKSALIKKLGKYKGGPAGLVGNARQLADLRGITVARAAAELIRDTYDKGRRERLPAL